jgi:formylglycine-generating enzyme required for sulfatase activity
VRRLKWWVLSAGVVLFASGLAVSDVAQAQASESFTDKLASGGEGPQLIRVPAGRFEMGGGDGDSWMAGLELPRHDVTINRPFALGRFEVTRAEYQKFVAATGRKSTGICHHLRNFHAYNSGDWRDPGFEQSDDHPVACISRADALAYLAWLSQQTGKKYRLPTEAEWEYAARAGGTSKYIGGDVLEDICRHGNVWDKDADQLVNPPEKYCGDGASNTSPVGKYLPNAWGLHDMTGNVAEMLADCFFENYRGAPADGSAWIKEGCTEFVERGGSWSTSGEYLRVAHRTRHGSDEFDSRMGLRVARELD